MLHARLVKFKNQRKDRGEHLHQRYRGQYILKMIINYIFSELMESSHQDQKEYRAF